MSLRPIVRCLVVPILALSPEYVAAHPNEAWDRPPEDAPTQLRVVNVNQAGNTELLRLPGFGERLCMALVTHRREHGPFRRPEDLMQLKGLGEKMFKRIRPYVVVSGPTTLTEKVRVRA